MRNQVISFILFFVSIISVGCCRQQPTQRIPLYPSNALNKTLEDVIYCHTESSATEVLLSENGIDYKVKAVGGQVMVFLKENVTHEDALKIIEHSSAKVIAQIPYLKYYLVEVGIGKESEYVSLMRNILDVDFVYPNIIGDICAASSFVIDNFNGDHGEKVAAMIAGCDPLMSITTYNVSPQDDERGINTNMAIESVGQTLKNLHKGDGAVFNMSFGPGLIKLWGIIPWQNRVLWEDHFVTDDNKKSYTRRYINELKTWVKLAAKFDDKDFVIVKGAGNEGMKQLETILDGLMNELSSQERYVFERHFLMVSARDDNKERDYPNDVSSYHKMVTKVDISDMTAQDLHWQGTSFSSPRVAGYISNAANEYNMKVVDVLQYVRETTRKAPDNVITYELLESEINKNPQVPENPVVWNNNDDIAADLIGVVIYEPSSNGYFPKDWRWKIEWGEVLGVEVLKRKNDEYGNEKIFVLAHLHRGHTKIDAKMVLKYTSNGYSKELKSSKVKEIIIPQQQDYSQYVRLKKDYDFFPSLVLHNKSDMTLFVGGDYLSGEERKLFAGVFEPHSSKTVAIGNIDSYHIHFAYLK